MLDKGVTIEKLEDEVRMLRKRVRELEAGEHKYKQTRKTLKKQQVRLYSLLNRLPAFVYLQAPDHSIRFANSYFKEHFGRPQGKKCHEVFRDRKYPCQECRTFNVFMTKDPQRWEWDCPVDGLSYEVHDYPFIDEDGTLLVLELGIDITERKRMENDLRSLQTNLEKLVEERTSQLKESVSRLQGEIKERKKTEDALRKSEERFALAVAGANEGLWYRDLETGEVHYSPRWKNMIGYKDHEIPNDPNEWKSRIHSDDYERVMNTLNWYLNGYIPVYEVEFRLRAKDGGYRWIRSRGACQRDAAGIACRIAGSHSDITDRKFMEDALRESEKKYRKIFEESRDVIFVFDADARLIDINPTASELFGYARDEFSSLDVANDIYCRPEDRDRFLRALFTNGFVKDMEVEVKRKNDERLIIHVSASVIRDRDDVITGYMGTIHDMTEHKKLEQQLLQSQKMESIGLLAGGIAHDFNNLLTAISGYGETIRENISDDNAVILPNINQVLLAAERARELTRNLLTVSRKQVLNPRPVPINEVVTDMHRLIARIIGENIELSTELSEKRLTVLADRSQLEQILINLAANARDAMPNGGALRISAGHSILNGNTKKIVGFRTPGPYAFISVTDSGTGITPDIRQKIFEPFFTTKEVGKGTGLGLSTSYSIARQHNGTITVDSEPGKGATFTLYLPLYLIETEKQTSVEKSIALEGKETILIAEDEEIVINFLQGILQRAGYKVITATNGEDALSRFHESGADISIVITDVVMPKKNGLELYEELHGLRPSVRFLFISGYTADVILQKGIFGAGVDFVTKPFSKNDILRKVREVLDRHA